MLIEERKIEVSQLRVGMFVCRLDRDWKDTPFLLQGFTVGDDDDIAALRRHCEHVYIDIEKGHDVDPSLLVFDASAEPEEIVLRKEVRTYHRQSSVEDELPRAADAVAHISESAAAILDALRAGDAVDHGQVRTAVQPVVASLVRNPDAFFWLQVLRKHGEYAYGHAVNCCALATALGRQLGMPETVLHDVAAGAMLMDIGMTTVPAALQQQEAPLADADWVTIRGHVAKGEALYRESGMNNPIVLDMLRHHHERYDGSGYPQALSGDGTPLYARIAGIVDSYDAMITPRPYREALSRHDALQRMYRERGRLYQDELIEQFMQSMGVYPVGSLVELSSGEVAIVMGQNPTRRLRPALMLLTDADKSLRSHFERLDLMLADKARLPQSELRIIRGLQAGAYGLQPSELYL
jgi:HD-GYP domain-containing protein (c-di-GMP phosphodiesterase class II)